MSGPLPDLDEPISFAVDNGAQAGPYPMRAIIESIRNGERASNTLVWWAGEADWVAFDSVPDLVALLEPAPPEEQPPPPAADESTPLAAAETVTVGADPAPGDATDVWRDVPADSGFDDTEVVTSEELAADFGSVVDSGSGLFETTPTDAFEDVSTGMPDDADGVGESLGEAFETLDTGADSVDDAEIVESPTDEAIVTEDLSDEAEVSSDDAEPAEEAVGIEATDTLIVSDAEGDDDGFDFTRDHDFFDPESEEGAEPAVAEGGEEVAEGQPPAPADDAQPTSLQSVSDRIEALGAESRAAIGGAGVLGSGERLFSAITDEPDLDPEAPIASDDSESTDDVADERVDVAEEHAEDHGDDTTEAPDAHDHGDADAPEADEHIDEAEADEHIDEAEAGEADDAEAHEHEADDEVADAEVDAALDELDDIAEEAEIGIDEPELDGEEGGGAPDHNADLEAHFGYLREAAASLESERSWAASLDDVMLSVIVGRALDVGYSVVDLRSLSPNHIARFERSTDAARLIVALDQLGPVATETQLSGHHTSMLMSWGRPVDADRLPESDEDSDAGHIGVHGDAEAGYAYTDVELIVPLNDYVDAEFALDDDSVGRDFDAAHHGLQREWYDRFG